MGPSLAYSPDGSVLATCSSTDGNIRLWSPALGVELLTLYEPANKVVFTPDGGSLVSQARSGTIRIWPSVLAE